MAKYTRSQTFRPSIPAITQARRTQIRANSIWPCYALSWNRLKTITCSRKSWKKAENLREKTSILKRMSSCPLLKAVNGKQWPILKKKKCTHEKQRQELYTQRRRGHLNCHDHTPQVHGYQSLRLILQPVRLRNQSKLQAKTPDRSNSLILIAIVFPIVITTFLFFANKMQIKNW